VPLFEFWWEHYVDRSRILLSSTTSAIVVTPAMSADCANVEHSRRDVCARMCVVAFWRLMPTKTRFELMGAVVDSNKNRRRWGCSWFVDPSGRAFDGPSPLDRYLGVRDLMAFD
jgi:hypothetical protein